MDIPKIPATSSTTPLSSLNKKPIFIALAVVLAVAGLSLAWQMKRFYAPETPAYVPPAQPQQVQTETPKDSLGSEIYENASNPINNTLPKTVAPTPNPIEGVYKNPFE